MHGYIFQLILFVVSSRRPDVVFVTRDGRNRQPLVATMDVVAHTHTATIESSTKTTIAGAAGVTGATGVVAIIATFARRRRRRTEEAAFGAHENVDTTITIILD